MRTGHRLATDGDTEVIVHLYEELGPDCVSELHGMFAFALWDSRRHQLLLARDRVGKKPLFYCAAARARSASPRSSAALMQDPEVPREIDHHALDAYLAYGYVPAPLSAFAGVRKLMPASTLVYRDGQRRASSATGVWTTPHKQPAQPAEELHEQIRDDDPPGRAAADGRGRSHRGIPFRRNRLLGGGGGDGRELAAAGQDVLDRLRGASASTSCPRPGWSRRSSRPTTTS